MFSDPVIGERFFGRGEILSILKKRVAGLEDGYRQNIAIIGEELLGKSSILRHFLSSFQSKSVIPIYLDIKTDSFSYFADKFSGVLLYHFLKQKGMEVSGDLKSLVAKSREFIPRTVEAIEKLPPLLNEKKNDQAYLALLDLTLILKQETGQKIILVLDEFHRLSDFNIKNPFTKLGKNIMVQQDTMYIVASSDPEKARKILVEDLSLLFGNFELIELGPFDFTGAMSFLEQRLSEINLGRENKRFLTAFTNGHPFYLNVLSLNLLKLAKLFREEPDDLTLMTRTIESSLFDSQGILNQYFTFSLSRIFKDGDCEAFIPLLLTIAAGKQRLKDIAAGMGLKVRDISKKMERLIELKLIAQNGTFYKFDDRMFEFWLGSVYRRKKVSLTPDLSCERKAFQSEVEAMILSFSAELKKDISQRVLELFRCFENEIIEIDRRRHRFPHFSLITNHGSCLRAFKPPAAREDKDESREGMWICTVKEKEATEGEVIEFLEAVKKSKPRKILQKILIAPAGMEDNARLLVKEKKIWAWDLEDLNLLLDLYGKPRLV